MFDLSGMSALVTGASGGIGSAIAKALAAQGARVALSGTREETLRELATQIGNPEIVFEGDRNELLKQLREGKAAAEFKPISPSVLPCNLADSAAVDALVPRAVEALAGLDILVNNAGVTRDNLALRMKDEEWTDVIRINLEAAFRLARAALKPMMRARFGRIISITSVVGATGNPGQANYAASKAGLVGMSKALAQEVASRNITVNCVAPGFIRSAMTEVLPETQKEALLGRIPAGKLGEGEDVAAACVYLASREAGYVTGQTVHVNGGMAMI